MGFSANGFCFDDVDGAAAYACGHDYPVAGYTVDGSGHSVAVVVECSGTSGNALTLVRSMNGSPDGTSTLALSSPACDTTEWQTYYPFSMSATTGAEVAAAVLAVWFIGWGWREIFAVLSAAWSGSVDSEE